MSTRAVQIELLMNGILHPTTSAPVSGGTVYFYSAGTETAKNVWSEKEKTNPYTSVTLDSDGTKQIYGDGVYKLVVKSSAGTTLYTWDNVKVRFPNYSTVTKTSTYTTTADDDLILANGTFTITLLAAASQVQPVIIKNVGTGTVTIATTGSETIEGSSTYSMATTDQALKFISDGSNYELAYNIVPTAVTLTSGATATFANAGLHILDSNATHDLIIKPGSNLSADRIFTITTGDAARTLSILENLSIGDGAAVTITAEDAAGAIVLDNCGLEVEDATNAGNKIKIVNANDDTDKTISLSENLTIGAGGNITLTAEDAAGAITLDNCGLEVEDATNAGNIIKLINANDDTDKTISLSENLTIGAGGNVTITAEDAASSITLDEQTFEVEGEGTATQLFKLVNAENAARTLTFYENLTVGNGNAGTLTFTGASKTLSVEGTSVVSQDYSVDAYPQFLGLNDGTYNIAIPTNGMAAAKFMTGNSSTIAWFYLNTAPPGWKALSTGADTVLGVAGGAGAYNVNGGNPDSSATWTISGLTTTHTHELSHTHTWSDTSDAASEVVLDSVGAGTAACGPHTHDVSGTTSDANDATTDSQSTTAVASSAAWRPSASVGKLFQLDTAA